MLTKRPFIVNETEGGNLVAGTNKSVVVLENWAYATSSSGQAYLLREIRKAKVPTFAVGKINEAMSRIEKGTARVKEFDLVKDDVYELRISADNRWFRVLYALHNGTYLALFFGAKKTNALDRGWISTASRRLKEYRKQNPT